MKYLVLVSLCLIMFTGLSMGFSSSTVPIQQQTGCNGTGIGDASANVLVEDQNIVVEGLYCANTGGYQVVEEEIFEEDGEINASVVIEGPSDDQIVTQVITPVEFSVSEEFDPGNYTVNRRVSLEDNIVVSGSEAVNVEAGRVEEQDRGFLLSLRRWFSGLF